jgi:hypothetical protein
MATAARRSTSKRSIIGKPVLTAAKRRSKLEDRIEAQIAKAGVPYTYEKDKVKYVVPSRKATYTPDFALNGKILIEAKGYFRKASDRQKLAFVREQHPDLDIRLVFQRSTNPIYKGSKTTYADWAESHGFKWADGGVIPDTWLKEAMK